MPNVFIILGDSKTRKSSTIRGLTGAGRKGRLDISTNNGSSIEVFVQIRSLQESKISPQSFISQITQDNPPNVLVSLRINQCNRKPKGQTYIQAFVTAGWNIMEIVVLGTNNPLYPLPSGLPSPFYISNSQNMPANMIANQIRQKWQWL